MQLRHLRFADSALGHSLRFNRADRITVRTCPSNLSVVCLTLLLLFRECRVSSAALNPVVLKFFTVFVRPCGRILGHCFLTRHFCSHPRTVQALFVKLACQSGSDSVQSMASLGPHVHNNSFMSVIVIGRLVKLKICHWSSRKGSSRNILTGIIHPQSVWKK